MKPKPRFNFTGTAVPLSAVKKQPKPTKEADTKREVASNIGDLM